MTVLEWGKNFSDKCDFSTHREMLEVGCRQGKISAYLAEQHPHLRLTGLDNMASELEHAQQYQHSNLQFMQQSAMHLSADAEFDAVVSFNCLLWIQDKQSVLKNIYAALKPGGKAFLQLFITPQKPKNDRFFYQTASEVDWKHYFKCFRPDYYEISLAEVCRLLHQTGFIMQSLDLVLYPVIFEHAQALQTWLKSWATHIKYLPIQKQEQFLYTATQRYLDFHHYAADAEITYKEYLLEVICEKPMHEERVETTHYYYGNAVFSKREAQVLKYFLQGRSAKETAQLLKISAKTIEFHLAKLKEKLDCSKRSEIFQIALRLGFVELMFDKEL